MKLKAIPTIQKENIASHITQNTNVLRRKSHSIKELRGGTSFKKIFLIFANFKMEVLNKLHEKYTKGGIQYQCNFIFS